MPLRVARDGFRVTTPYVYRESAQAAGVTPRLGDYTGGEISGRPQSS